MDEAVGSSDGSQWPMKAEEEKSNFFNYKLRVKS